MCVVRVCVFVGVCYVWVCVFVGVCGCVGVVCVVCVFL